MLHPPLSFNYLCNMIYNWSPIIKLILEHLFLPYLRQMNLACQIPNILIIRILLFVQLSGCCQDFHPKRKCCFPATLKVILIASEHSHCTFQSLPCWWSRCGFFKIDFFFFVFGFLGPSYAKLCLEVHWAAQIRAWCVDVGLQGWIRQREWL